MTIAQARIGWASVFLAVVVAGFGAGTVAGQVDQAASGTVKFVTLHSFCSQPNCVDGDVPGPLVQGTNGDLFGLAGSGGTSGLSVSILY